MNWGVIGFDIAMLIVAGLLIPIGIKIISVLNSLLVSIKNVSSMTEKACESVAAIHKELTNAHLRDKDLENRLFNIEKSLGGK